MNIILLAITLISVSIAALLFTLLMAKHTIVKVNTRNKEVLKRIEKERMSNKSRYFVYLEAEERKYLRDVYGFEAFGCSFFVLTIFVYLSDSEKINVILILILLFVGVLFSVVAPTLGNIFTLLRSRNIFAITNTGIEQWQQKKGNIERIIDIDWLSIRHVWAIKVEHYPVVGKDNFRLLLLYDLNGMNKRKGRIEVHGYWRNTQLLMRDALRYATYADLGISEPFMRDWLRKKELI